MRIRTILTLLALIFAARSLAAPSASWPGFAQVEGRFDRNGKTVPKLGAGFFVRAGDQTLLVTKGHLIGDRGLRVDGHSVPLGARHLLLDGATDLAIVDVPKGFAKAPLATLSADGSGELRIPKDVMARWLDRPAPFQEALGAKDRGPTDPLAHPLADSSSVFPINERILRGQSIHSLGYDPFLLRGKGSPDFGRADLDVRPIQLDDPVGAFDFHGGPLRTNAFGGLISSNRWLEAGMSGLPLVARRQVDNGTITGKFGDRSDFFVEGTAQSSLAPLSVSSFVSGAAIAAQVRRFVQGERGVVAGSRWSMEGGVYHFQTADGSADLDPDRPERGGDRPDKGGDRPDKGGGAAETESGPGIRWRRQSALALQLGGVPVVGDRLSLVFGQSLPESEVRAIPYGAELGQYFRRKAGVRADRFSIYAPLGGGFVARDRQSAVPVTAVRDPDGRLHASDPRVARIDYDHGKLHVELPLSVQPPNAIVFDLDAQGKMAAAPYSHTLRVTDTQGRHTYLIDVRGLYFLDLYEIAGRADLSPDGKLHLLRERMMDGPAIRFRDLCGDPHDRCDRSTYSLRFVPIRDGLPQLEEGGGGCHLLEVPLDARRLAAPFGSLLDALSVERPLFR